LKHIIIIANILLLFSNLKLNAQNAFTGAGNNAFGAGGSVSYSMGQVAYETSSNINGSISTGVQQAFEIFSVDIFEQVFEDFSISVYPNPSSGKITLVTSTLNYEDLSYQISDLNGKYIASNILNLKTNIIDMLELPTSIYFITILKDGIKIKTFKILKK